MTTKKWKRTVSRINIGFDETSKNSSYNLLGIGQTPGKESFGNQSFLYNAVFYFGGPKNEEHLCQREPLRPQDGSFFMTKTCKRSNFLFVSLYKICEISFSDQGIYLRASKINTSVPTFSWFRFLELPSVNFHLKILIFGLIFLKENKCK